MRGPQPLHKFTLRRVLNCRVWSRAAKLSQEDRAGVELEEPRVAQISLLVRAAVGNALGTKARRKLHPAPEARVFLKINVDVSQGAQIVCVVEVRDRI